MATPPKKTVTAKKTPVAKPTKAAPKTSATVKKVAAKPTKSAAATSTAVANAKSMTSKAADYRAQAETKARQLADQASGFASQAGDRAKGLAQDGKDRAADTLSNFAKMIEDSAGAVDEKLGKQYGDFARSAAKTVASFATTVEKQDIDELASNTRDFVKKSPAIAIGTAAVVGFVLARMLKGSGSNDA
jgi:ElaB/YqjD/DUF883 family membrane-anchored ribosome-binding protein